jgi:hypothetical protein
MAKISTFDAFLNATQIQESSDKKNFEKLNKMINNHISKELNAVVYSGQIEITREQKKCFDTPALVEKK